MALAIRVIKENARFFGGDPDRITISGESAGGWAVGMQVFIFQIGNSLFTPTLAEFSNSDLFLYFWLGMALKKIVRIFFLLT